MTASTWPATGRYGVEPAPGGLGLVQDLLNTFAAGTPREPDLLASPDVAQKWADQALGRWTAATGQHVRAVVLDANELEELRTFRDDLHQLIAQGPPPNEDGQAPAAVLHSAAASLQLGDDGIVRLEPRGTGWHRVAALILTEALQAQLTDTMRRLKTCRNPRCRVGFYDRSRNNSGVWHDVRTCGNAANLRAYRARQRAQTT